MNLYRAANSTTTEFTTCFASDEAHGAFYLDNRPFGGDTLYRVTLPRPAEGAVYRCAGNDASECLISFLDNAFGQETRQEVWSRNYAACVGSLLSEPEGRSLIESFAAANPLVEWLVFQDSDHHGETWMSLRPSVSASWEEIPRPLPEGFECALCDGNVYSLDEARECLADEPELRFELVVFPGYTSMAEVEAEMRAWRPVYVQTGRFVS